MNSQKTSLVAICGKGKIAVSALRHVYQLLSASILDFRLVVCPTRDDRGYDTWRPSLSKAARSIDVDVVELDSLFGEEGLLLISLEFDQILKVHKFTSKRLFNIHFSKLPKYRGVYTSTLQVLNGEAESGV